MRPSTTWAWSRKRSPQQGLAVSAVTSGLGNSPRLRGWVKCSMTCGLNLRTASLLAGHEALDGHGAAARLRPGQPAEAGHHLPASAARTHRLRLDPAHVLRQQE